MKGSRLENVGSAAAGIAHDINNQLNLIVNHLSVRDIEAAMEAAARCTALTGSLLSYCKGATAAIVPTDPVTFLLRFLGKADMPEGVKLHLNIPPSLPPIAAEPMMLTRILTNLAINACDAMRGKGMITISAKPQVIAVEDTGPGIPEENRHRVFEPFFTTKGEAGTGLGLAIVRELMRQQGGSVSLESHPGRGAKFILRFRRA